MVCAPQTTWTTAKALRAHGGKVLLDHYGQLIDLSGKDIDKVASLPTREQALSMLLGVLKAPIEKFVRTVAAPHTKLVRTVAAVRDAKQAAGA